MMQKKKPTVLIVDDTPANLALLFDYLEQQQVKEIPAMPLLFLTSHPRVTVLPSQFFVDHFAFYLLSAH